MVNWKVLTALHVFFFINLYNPTCLFIFVFLLLVISLGAATSLLCSIFFAKVSLIFDQVQPFHPKTTLLFDKKYIISMIKHFLLLVCLYWLQRDTWNSECWEKNLFSLYIMILYLYLLILEQITRVKLGTLLFDSFQAFLRSLFIKFLLVDFYKKYSNGNTFFWYSNYSNYFYSNPFNFWISSCALQKF